MVGKPPPVLLDILTQLIDTPHHALVVDLGSGTGLSTMIWSAQAQHVIGIESYLGQSLDQTRLGHGFVVEQIVVVA